MSGHTIVLGVFVAFGLAAGQVLFKFAANDIQNAKNAGTFLSLFNPWLMGALIVYGVTTALWVWILTIIPLSRAYPLVLLSAALIPLASYYFFNEIITPQYIFGFFLVMIGLFIIQSSN